MKQMNLFILFLFFIIISCTADYKYGIEQVEWLLGSWENRIPQGTTIESWQKLNDTSLTATSFLVTKTDSVLIGKIKIVQKNNNLFYIPSVVNQNEGKAIEFELTKATLNSMTFENSEHDFPQKISYTKINNDSLVAVIYGISDGKEKSIQFPMKRK